MKLPPDHCQETHCSKQALSLFFCRTLIIFIAWDILESTDSMNRSRSSSTCNKNRVSGVAEGRAGYTRYIVDSHGHGEETRLPKNKGLLTHDFGMSPRRWNPEILVLKFLVRWGIQFLILMQRSEAVEGLWSYSPFPTKKSQVRTPMSVVAISLVMSDKRRQVVVSSSTKNSGTEGSYFHCLNSCAIYTTFAQLRIDRHMLSKPHRTRALGKRWQ